MIELAVKAVLSYLVGSLVGSLLFGRLFGAGDIRSEGSGNAGATNALRTHGWPFAVLVAAFDVAKGWIAVSWIAPLQIPGIAPAAPSVQLWLAVSCGFAAILGHVYPVLHGFRGGKGGATAIGAVLALSPVSVLLMLLVWLMVVVVLGFVGLGTMTAAAMLPLILLATGATPRGPLLVFGMAVAALVIFSHRRNIERMRNGTEPRARRLWLLGRGRR
jgi:glycerol-3-phosphate acyltransferase PlsY